jgi:hypothetical protein
MGRSYRPTAYLGFGRVYFNIAASDAPEPLNPSKLEKLEAELCMRGEKRRRPVRRCGR